MRRLVSATDTSGRNIGRRLLLGGSVAGLATPYIKRAKADGRVLNFASYGGTFGDALRKAWLDPFERETGIKVNLGVNASLALAKLQTLGTAGAEWDIVDLTAGEYEVAVRQNMVLPLDGRVNTSRILPEYVKSHGFFYGLFVYVMGWDKRVVKPGDEPKTWAEFFDTKKYPGKRTLQTVRTNGNTIEAALLADGVPFDKMYPLDIERALRCLDTKIGKDNIVWAETNQEPIQRIMSGETPLGGVFTTRAIIANRAGGQIGFNVSDGLCNGDLLSVIRTARNPAEAFEFLNYVATKPDRAAEFMAIAAVDVPHMDAAALISPDAADAKAALATSPTMRDKVHITNVAYWADNLERVATRLKEWQLS